MPKMPGLRLEGAAGNLLRAPLDDMELFPRGAVVRVLSTSGSQGSHADDSNVFRVFPVYLTKFMC